MARLHLRRAFQSALFFTAFGLGIYVATQGLGTNTARTQLLVGAAELNYTNLFAGSNLKVSDTSDVFYESIDEKVTPYDGLRTINLQKITVPRVGRAQIALLLNATVLWGGNVLDKGPTTAEKCYTSEIQYFVSRNSFPDLYGIDASSGAKSPYPTSPNIAAGIIKAPQNINTYSLFITKAFAAQPLDNFYVVLTLPRYPISKTFGRQFRTECKFIVQLNATFLSASQKFTTLQAPTNVNGLLPRQTVKYMNKKDSPGMADYSAVSFTENLLATNETRDTYNFELFSDDETDVLFFNPEPSKICAGSTCFSNISKLYYPDKGVYTVEYNRTINASIYIQPACQADCYETKNLGECRLYNWADAGRVAGCVCKNRLRGLGCENPTGSMSYREIITEVLFLTLSNLAFLPVTIVAWRRQLYAESLVFGLVMFSSLFYHACDQWWTSTSFCLLGSYNTLQSMDFYTSSIAVWYSGFAIAGMGMTLKLPLLAVATYLGVLLVVYDRFSLMVYLIPSVVCVIMVPLFWSRFNYWPPRAYYWKQLFPGLFLVVLGVCCKVFLESDLTYWYVHSLWHIFLAFGLLIALPNDANEMDKKYYEAFAAEINQVKFKMTIQYEEGVNKVSNGCNNALQYCRRQNDTNPASYGSGSEQISEQTSITGTNVQV